MDDSKRSGRDISGKNRFKTFLPRERLRIWGAHQVFGAPLTLVILILVGSILISPYLAERGSVNLGEDGVVGERDHGDEISEIDNPLARRTYRFGDYWCHQKSSRSLNLNYNQMAVCSRDLGLFLGLLLGSVLGILYTRRITLLFPFILVLPMAADGLLQYASAYESNNLLRIVTGLSGGVGIASYLNRNIVHLGRLIMVNLRRGE